MLTSGHHRTPWRILNTRPYWQYQLECWTLRFYSPATKRRKQKTWPNSAFHALSRAVWLESSNPGRKLIFKAKSTCEHIQQPLSSFIILGDETKIIWTLKPKCFDTSNWTFSLFVCWQSVTVLRLSTLLSILLSNLCLSHWPLQEWNPGYEQTSLPEASVCNSNSFLNYALPHSSKISQEPSGADSNWVTQRQQLQTALYSNP